MNSTFLFQENFKRLKTMVVKDGIKMRAILIDEFHLFAEEGLIRELQHLASLVDIIWIAPVIASEYENIDHFTTINLTYNLRNTKEIVLEAEKTVRLLSLNKEFLTMPPSNFPRGCRPIYVAFIDDGLDTARGLTHEGILVIDAVAPKNAPATRHRHGHGRGRSAFNGNPTSYYSEYIKMHGVWSKQIFKKQISPYELLMNGKILIARIEQIHGFEWPTVIFINDIFSSTRNNVESFCNQCMRCTLQLFIART